MIDLRTFSVLLFSIIMGVPAGNWASVKRKGTPMLEFYVESTAKRERLLDGPFKTVVEPLACWLRDQGYAKLTGAVWFKDICRFNSWFNANGYRGKPVNEDHVHGYLEQCGSQKVGSYAPVWKNGKRSLFPRLFALLQEQNAPKPVKSASGPATSLDEYETHLVDWYGASKSTVRRHRQYAEVFHSFAFGKAKPDWRKVKPGIVLDFVRRQVETSPTRPRDIIGCLRCYFRYLKIRGHETARLLDVLPHIRREARPLPERLLSPEQVKKWLAGFERSTPEGLRNYAMALCLADLGLRVGDLAALRLEDLNWRNGTIRIHNSKTRRAFWLPLPARTGKAITTYLRRGRPKSNQREVFLRHKTPLNVPLSAEMIERRMKRVAKEQGISWCGVHALRHTAATRMRTGGASLKEIADVLGHVNLGSTAIYAKIDIRELAKVALPWPEGQP